MPKSIEEFEKLRKQPKSVETFEAIRTGSSFSVSDPIFKKQPKEEPSLWENVVRNLKDVYHGVGSMIGSAGESFERGEFNIALPAEATGRKPLPDIERKYPPIKEVVTGMPKAIGEHYHGYLKDPLGKVHRDPVDALLDAFVVAGLGKSVVFGASRAAAKASFKMPKGHIRSGATLFETTPSPVIDISIQKVTQALKETKPVRKQQEALYTKERKARLAKLRGVQEKTTGEKGFHAELGQLKGEMPKVVFESIRKKVSQTDIDNLFNRVKDADILTDWEKITAREGLAKMFGEYGGRVPTRGELMLLEQVFPPDFLSAVLAKRPLWTKMKDAGLQLFNIPRSAMASFDLSFGGRQGAFAAPKFRREFWTSWKKQFKEFGLEKAYQAGREVLIKDKEFKFAKESKISFTDVGRMITQREEMFASQWAEKIPLLIGRGIRASGRAYTGFANRYRLDMFKSMVRDAERMGYNPRANRQLARQIADFVNNATGRGSLGGFENASLVLNTVFFSPRLNMARIRLLNPVHYITRPKFVRKQAITTALAAAGTATTMLTLADLAGADVTYNPLNADFGKIKIRNTRIDMLAGFGQFIRSGAQVIMGQYISSTTGRKVNLGEGYRPLTRMDVLIRQVESKEAPLFSYATQLLRGKNWAGEDFNALREAGNRFVPMVVSDMYELAREDPELLGLSVPAIFGFGVMTYPSRSRRSGGR